ncbi:hypothetical protein ACK8GE_07485 [Micromonosporaceae bacterium DT194]|uniref:hypothetical protein n=1 Tax=Melissospora conviva TaxID=3388432 RepID=UPI003C132B92
MASRFQRVVHSWQWTAVTAIPILLIAMSAAAGGGLLFGAFILLAAPLGLVLAVPPAVGRFVGRMRSPADVTFPYAVCTVGVSLACCAYGAAAIAEEFDVRGTGPGLVPVAVLCVLAFWIAQVTTGALARRRTARAGGSPAGAGRQPGTL